MTAFYQIIDTYLCKLLSTESLRIEHVFVSFTIIFVFIMKLYFNGILD